MSDYAAATVQVIAEGLLTIDAAGNPQITGQGFAAVARASVNPGDFTLDLEEGTGVADVSSGTIVNRPGTGGFPDGRVGPNGVDTRLLRVEMTMRGGTTAPGSTTIADLSVGFIAAAGTTQLRIALGTALDAPTDPMGAGAPNAAGGGLEIIVFYGNATPDSFTQQAFGPAYQPALTFP